VKTRVLVTDGERLHIVRSLRSLHDRYYRSVGAVVGKTTDDRYKVVVYGEVPMRMVQAWALVRLESPRPAALDYRREWSPERLAKRIRQHRKSRRRTTVPIQ
jgi:hypothetical protein